MTSAQKILAALIAAAVLAAAVGGALYWRGSAARPALRPELPADAVLIFSDRRDPRYERIFAIRGRAAAAQKHVFPSYAEKTAFAREDLPAELVERAREWGRCRGSARPPFSPGGTWYAMTVLGPPGSGPGETEFFRNDDARFQEWVGELGSALMAASCRVERPPAWAAGDPRIMRHLDPWAVK